MLYEKMKHFLYLYYLLIVLIKILIKAKKNELIFWLNWSIDWISMKKLKSDWISRFYVLKYDMNLKILEFIYHNF